MEGNFKSKMPFKKRLLESSKIISKYPGRIPIVVEKHTSCELPTIEKFKYLVPQDMTISQFIFVIRKGVKLNQDHALFITVNKSLVSSNSTVLENYEEHKDKDGFLYVIYTSENTFG